MNQMDHALEYSEVIDCVHVKLTNDLFFCVCCFGWPLCLCVLAVLIPPLQKDKKWSILNPPSLNSLILLCVYFLSARP